MPLGHLGLNVPDLARAKSYYDGLMPLLSFEPFFSTEGEFSYRPADGKVGTWIFFYPALEEGAHVPVRAGLGHLAFIVKTRAEVHAVHDWAVAQGSEVVHPPREWPEYHEGYYAVFFTDPSGFLLEVVCHRDATA